MTHAGPVMIGVDGSPAAAVAIRYGAQEARRLGTGLVLVHAVPDYVPMAPMLPLVPSDLRNTGRELLSEAAREASSLIDASEVSTSLLSGPRIAALLESARHARLVVLGSQRRPLVDRVLTGSTLVGLAARAGAPVVAVPAEWAPEGPTGTILVGVKSVDHSSELVRRGLEIAEQRHGRVLLVHAWGLPDQYDDLVTSRVDADEWAGRARRELEERLRGLCAGFPSVPLEVRVVHGQPARVLERASGEADLLLLARRQHAFPLGHLGGTGRALLRESHCPVEVVPPADEPADTTGLVVEKSGAILK